LASDFEGTLLSVIATQGTFGLGHDQVVEVEKLLVD
jgi:hypothetical protein